MIAHGVSRGYAAKTPTPAPFGAAERCDLGLLPPLSGLKWGERGGTHGLRPDYYTQGVLDEPDPG